MPRKTNLYKKLKARGLTVEYVPGWSTRGSSSFAPKGVVAHWTAGPRGSTKRPSLRVVTYGHGGLPGPLCNVYLDRNGVAVVVSAGRANHAGGGSWKGHSGNTSFLGIEAEAADGADWTDAQREAYPLVCAALLDAIGEDDASYVCGHSEYALPRGRKIDINGYTTTDLRRQTQAVLNGIVTPAAPSKPTPIEKDWFDMVSKSEMSDLLDARLEAFAAREPKLKGAAAKKFGEHHNSRDDLRGYAGLAWDQTRGLRDLIREVDAGVSAQEVAELILERTDSAKAGDIVDLIAARLKG